MSRDHDPVLDSLFASAREELADDNFVAWVTARLEARRRRLMLGRLAIVAVLVVLEQLLDAPLQNSISVITEVLGTPIFSFTNTWLVFVFAPINSTAGLLGLGLLGLHFLYRRMFY